MEVRSCQQVVWRRQVQMVLGTLLSFLKPCVSFTVCSEEILWSYLEATTEGIKV